MDIKEQLNAIFNRKLNRQEFLKVFLLSIVVLLGFGTVAALMLKLGKKGTATKVTVTEKTVPNGSGQAGSSQRNPDGTPVVKGQEHPKGSSQPNASTKPSSSPTAGHQSSGTTGQQSSDGTPSGMLVGPMEQGLTWNLTIAPSTWTYVASQGANICRSWFAWENVTPSLGGPVSSSWVNTYLIPHIDQAWAAGIKIVVTCGNYARYPFGGNAYWGNGITTAQFASMWGGLSKILKGHPGIQAYDLMNEPYSLTNGGTMTQEGAVAAAFQQAAVNAIRANGDNTEIWLEGSNWAGANLQEQFPGGPSTFVKDSANNLVYEVHIYPAQYPYVNSYGTTINMNFDTFIASATWNNLDGIINSYLKPTFDWVAGARVCWGEWGLPSYQAMVRGGYMNTTTANIQYQKWNNFFIQLMNYCKSRGMYACTQHIVGESPLAGAPFCTRAGDSWSPAGGWGPLTVDSTTTAAGVIFPNSSWANLWH